MPSDKTLEARVGQLFRILDSLSELGYHWNVDDVYQVIQIVDPDDGGRTLWTIEHDGYSRGSILD